MSTAVVTDVISWLLLGLGALVIPAAAIAILRMPTFYSRIHAASVNETLGAALILGGLAFQADGRWDVVVKLLFVLVFFVLTGPITAHALAKAARDNNLATGQYQRRRPKGGDASSS